MGLARSILLNLVRICSGGKENEIAGSIRFDLDKKRARC